MRDYLFQKKNFKINPKFIIEVDARFNDTPDQNTHKRIFHATTHNTQKQMLFVNGNMEILYAHYLYIIFYQHICQ